MSLVKSASSKLALLYCLYQFFSPHQLHTIYRGLVCPCMEYACHVWESSTHTALLDRVELKAFQLISSPPLTSCLLPLKFCRIVASLSIFYEYFHGNCSSELATPSPPPTDLLYMSFFTSSLLYCPNPLCKSEPVPPFLYPFHW